VHYFRFKNKWAVVMTRSTFKSEREALNQQLTIEIQKRIRHGFWKKNIRKKVSALRDCQGSFVPRGISSCPNA